MNITPKQLRTEPFVNSHLIKESQIPRTQNVGKRGDV